MKTFVWHYKKQEDPATYRVTWYEKTETGSKELCATTARVTGNDEAVQASLAFVAAELQRQHADLFVIEPEEMDPMRMEGENVQH